MATGKRLGILVIHVADFHAVIAAVRGKAKGAPSGTGPPRARKAIRGPWVENAV